MKLKFEKKENDFGIFVVVEHLKQKKPSEKRNKILKTAERISRIFKEKKKN